MKTVLKILAGVLFIVSAVAKLLSADIFELYVFGLGLTPMGLSFVLARVVIAFELFLGIWMLSGVRAVWSSAVALLSLAAFSGFLIWRMWLGDSANCHCFGELIDFTPQQSLVKNMALTAALLPTLWRKSWLNLRHGALYVALAAVVSLAVVLIVSPPDNFRYGSYSSSAFNEEEYRKSVDAGELPPSLDEGEKVICFFSTACRYCRMSAGKLATMRTTGFGSETLGLRERELVCVFPYIISEGVPSIDDFMEETGLTCDNILQIDGQQLLRITRGALPMILVMSGGKVLAEYGYRDLH